MDFLRLYKHLLPRAKAWRITLEKPLRSLFVGLSGFPGRARTFLDEVYLDLFPETTRELDAWESGFALINSAGLSTAQRRERLSGAWKAQGGQSPRYLQDALQAAGFDVYVHEAWLPATSWPNGPAVYRNPNLYLATGAPLWLMNDGAESAQDGDGDAQDGASSTPTGYPLVNKILVRGELGDGSLEMNDGGFNAQDGAISSEYTSRAYIVPTDPNTFPYFLYIGGATFPDSAIVPTARRDEFENLCLKLCPAHLWLGMLITYA